MSTAPARPSRATAVVFSALAVVLLYFLSAPPIKYYSTRYSFHFSRTTFDPRLPEGRETLARAYAGPYDWLEKQTPLRLLLEPYGQWWYDFINWGLL